MKKTYKIIYIETALNDLEEIIIYVKDRNKSYVDKFINSLDNKINQLKQFPFMGKSYMNVRLHDEYRTINIDQYLVFYVIIDDIVEIRRIIHEKRDYNRFI